MLMDFIFSLFGMILTIFIIVGVHEGAHFAVARFFGIKVLQCSIGFGKALYRWHDKKGTQYVIAPIPLGGYVKLLDENEGPVSEAEKHLAFNRQPLYKRMAVVAAGPFSNLILAFLLYWVVFVSGFATPIPLIGRIEPHSIASNAGLQSQQEIIEINGHKTRSWADISMQLVVHAGDQDTLTIKTLTAPENIQTHLLNLQSWEMNSLKPDPLSSLGITPYMPEIPLIIGKIAPHSTAASSLKIGDKLLLLNNEPIKNWKELIHFISKHPEQEITLTIQRDQKKLNIVLLISYQRNFLLQKRGFLGIAPDFEFPSHLLRRIQYGPLESFTYSLKEVATLSYFNVVLLGKLVTAKISMLSLGGPITIFEIAGSSFLFGVIPFLSFLAFLSIALGIINFLPIPGLDGGHILFQIIEGILRHPISIRLQMLFYRLGFIFLIVILSQALINDLLRLF